MARRLIITILLALLLVGTVNAGMICIGMVCIPDMTLKANVTMHNVTPYGLFRYNLAQGPYGPGITFTFTNHSTGNDREGWTFLSGAEQYGHVELINGSNAWYTKSPNASFGGRTKAAMTRLPSGTLMLAGGFGGGWGGNGKYITDSGWYNDTWLSLDDGYTWVSRNASSGWCARDSLKMVTTSNGHVFVIGGFGDPDCDDYTDNYRGDVWRSTNSGLTWTEMCHNCGWDARAYFGAAAIDNATSTTDTLLIFGGWDGVTGLDANDVWASYDEGATWNLVTASAEWQPRDSFTTSVTWNRTVVTIGGGMGDDWWSDNQTWSSADAGKTWTMTSDNLAEFTGTGAGPYDCAWYMPDDTYVFLYNNGPYDSSMISYSRDFGKTWYRTAWYDLQPIKLTEPACTMTKEGYPYFAGGFYSRWLSPGSDPTLLKYGNNTHRIIPWTFGSFYMQNGVLVSDASLGTVGGSTGLEDFPGGDYTYYESGRIRPTLLIWNATSYNITRARNETGYTGVDLEMEPIVDFTQDRTTGMIEQNVVFTDMTISSPPATHRWWYMRDATGNDTQYLIGEDDRMESRTFEYTFYAGNWSVLLEEENDFGTNTSVEYTHWVNITETYTLPPVASFTMEVDPVDIFGITYATFTDTSTYVVDRSWRFNNVTGNNTWVWFDDLSPSEKDFTPGNFSIELNVSNSVGFDTEYKFLNISAPPQTPIADFTMNATSGSNYLAVAFTGNASGGAPDNYGWYFRNDTGNLTWVGFGNGVNAEHGFGVGEYSIMYYITNDAGASNSIKTISVNHTAAAVSINANFTHLPSPSNIGETVYFTDTSTQDDGSPAEPVSWEWWFGDELTANSSSTEQNPTHTYTAAGTYLAFLNVTNSTGSFSGKSAFHTVTGRSAMGEQDVWMAATNMLQTFYIYSSTSGQLIPIVNLRDNLGQTNTTSAGIGYLTEGTGYVTVTFTADGYNTGTEYYLITEAATHNVTLTPTSDDESKLNMLYPHEVRIMTMDRNGQTLDGVFVDAYMMSSTVDNTNWLTSLFGMSDSMSPKINETHLNGTTDSRGSIVFPMIGSGKYLLTFTDATRGIHQTEEVHPDQAYYVYVLDTLSTALPANPHDNVNITLTSFASGTDVYLNASYNDTLATTTSVTYFIEYPNRTRFYSQNFTSISSIPNVAYPVSNVAGDAYVWGIEAYTSTFGWRNMSQGIDLKGMTNIAYNPFEYKDKW